MAEIKTRADQLAANAAEDAKNRARSLDNSNTNFQSGTGTVPVKGVLDAAEIADVEARTGLPVVVSPAERETPEDRLPKAETPEAPKRTRKPKAS